MEQPKSFLERLKEGDGKGLDELYTGYQQRLLALVRKRLGKIPLRSFDEEDVVQSVMGSFMKQLGIPGSAAQTLESDEDLLPFLFTIATRKTSKRIGIAIKKPISGESVFGADAGLEQFATKDDEDAIALELVEIAQHRLKQLPDQLYVQIALLRLEGKKVVQIADILNISKRSIERKLKDLKKVWLESEASESESQ